MKTRPLRWDDVKAELRTQFLRFDKSKPKWEGIRTPIANTSGENCIYARLHNIASVSAEFWVKKPDLNSPALQAAILLKLQRNLRKLIHRLKTYEQTENTKNEKA